MPYVFNPFTGKFDYFEDPTILELSSDPASPTAEETWVLREGSSGIADGVPIGMLLALTYTDNLGSDVTYKLAYRTKAGTTVYIPLAAAGDDLVLPDGLVITDGLTVGTLTGVLRADTGVVSVDTNIGKRVIGVMVVPPGTATATGDGKAFFRIPSLMNGWNLVGVAMNVYTAGTTGTTDVQIRNVTDSVDMLSTKLTIDSTETDSSTATPAVINTSNDDVATGDKIAIDVDAVHTTPAQGLYVEMTFQLP